MCRLPFVVGCSLLASLACLAPAAEGEGKARSRTFQFTYAATIKGLTPGQKVRVWVPVPPTLPEQTVRVIEQTWSALPERGQTGYDSLYSNKILHMQTSAEGREVSLRLVYEITRREVKGEVKREDSASLQERLLQPDSLVPISGKPVELIKDKKLPEDPMKQAQVLYDVVNEHMRYSKEGKGWGRGDAAWACDSKFGNCSDFHSLFISLARSRKLPARFEMGFGLPEKRGEGVIGGYHCWAFFRPSGKGWVPVDISEANKNPKMRDYYFGNLTEDRVTFSTGRDITLVPRQASPAINFLIYPHVEVEGKVWPQEKIDKLFRFKDVARRGA